MMPNTVNATLTSKAIKIWPRHLEAKAWPRGLHRIIANVRRISTGPEILHCYWSAIFTSITGYADLSDIGEALRPHADASDIGK